MKKITTLPVTLSNEENSEVLLDIQELVVWFTVRTGLIEAVISRRKQWVHAVDGVSLKIRRGEVVCLVGESGCGKTTLAKSLVGLVKPSSGKILFYGEDIMVQDRFKWTKLRRQIQMVFQDPYESLNPFMSVFDIVAEPLEANRLAYSDVGKMKNVKDAMESTGLTPAEYFFNKYPHQLSGGERQRVAIAAALIVEPKLIVADEPLSMLDASIRADILKLMFNLNENRGLTYLFITHDLAIARHFGDRIAVMYLGKILEVGKAKEVTSMPLNPYTKALVSVAPTRDPKVSEKQPLLAGEPPSAVSIPRGCRFHPRCPMAESICSENEPQLREVTTGHYTACHFAERLLKAHISG